MTYQTAHFGQDFAVRHSPVCTGIIGLPKEAVYISSALLHMPALDANSPSQAATMNPSTKKTSSWIKWDLLVSRESHSSEHVYIQLEMLQASKASSLL